MISNKNKTNHLTSKQTFAINNSTNILKSWSSLSWNYFKEGELRRNLTKICIICNHFRYSTTDTFAIILICPIQKKIMP